MLTVTAQAAEKIRGDLQAAATDPEVGVRLIPSPSIPNRIEMVLDKEKEGDQAVESEGVKILLLDPEIAQALEGMVVDYEETPQGGRFTISKAAPGM
jgi:Fe-S cluster assembly iron-binding protein IscA